MVDPFKEFRKILPKFEDRWESSNSKHPRYKMLEERCMEHVGENCSGLIGETNIVGVHIYFKEGGNLNNITDKKMLKMENLIRVSNKEKFRTVLFEDPLYYAEKTYKLIEEGVVDNVILTQQGRAEVLNRLDLNIFDKTKINYVGGSYEFRCLNRVILDIRENSGSRVIRIRDALRYPPKNNNPSYDGRTFRRIDKEPGPTMPWLFEYIFKGTNTGSLLRV